MTKLLNLFRLFSIFRLTVFRQGTNLAVSFLLMGALALSACDDAQSRADGHYQNGLALLADGEAEKAALEFRNAIALNKNFVEPRVEYGKLLMQSGDLARATNALEGAIEIDPAHLDARKMLARIMILARQFPTAKLHVDAAMRTAPDDVEVRNLMATTELRLGNMEEARDISLRILNEIPSEPAATQVLASVLMKEEAYDASLALLDETIEFHAGNIGLHLTKLEALKLKGDDDQVGAQLRTLFELAPRNRRFVDELVAWHIKREDNDSAVDLLRQRIELFPDNVAYKMALVEFRGSTVGIDAARQELAVFAQAAPDETVFEVALAQIDERDGKPNEAISRLENLLTQDVGDAKADITMRLAHLLFKQDRMAEARDLTARTLSDDPTNVEALTLRGMMHIENDRPEAAISDLRSALDGSPQNPRILTVLAQAHERNGSRGLAQERLALAVRASNSGIEESLRYAEFLMRDEKITLAEEVLKDAVLANPGSIRIRGALSKLFLSQSKWREALEMADGLAAATRNPRAQQIAQEIRIATLTGQKRFEESVGALREMWDSTGEKTSAMENLVRTYLQTGEPDEAMAFLDEVLSTEPKNMRANLLIGAIHIFNGDTAAALSKYEDVIAYYPESETGYGALARLLMSMNEPEEANAVIKRGLAAAKDAPGLMFAEAGRFERAGEFEKAISIYEDLYEDNKISDVLANNYASLLAEYRQDEESLERAYNVAKRLRSSTNPAFQDTYGWILYQRGDYERALQPLKSAAKGIPNNPVVLFHLGMLYAALEKDQEAISALSTATQLFKGTNFPQAEVAASTLETLKAKQ